MSYRYKSTMYISVYWYMYVVPLNVKIDTAIQPKNTRVRGGSRIAQYIVAVEV
jgi:hypothetical protein